MSYTQLKPCWVLIVNNRHVPSSLWNTRDITGKPHQELGHTDLVFGVMHLPNSLWYALPHTLRFPLHDNDNSDLVLSSSQILNVPLLLLANKQDSPDSLSATEIRMTTKSGISAGGRAHGGGFVKMRTRRWKGSVRQ